MSSRIIKCICVVIGLVSVLSVPSVYATHNGVPDTAVTWQANTEPDMAKYRLWICKTAGCTAIRTGNTVFAEVPHVQGQASYVFTLPANMVGSISADAVDTSGNPSLLSNQIPFSTIVDTTPPKAVMLLLK